MNQETTTLLHEVLFLIGSLWLVNGVGSGILCYRWRKEAGMNIVDVWMHAVITGVFPFILWLDYWSAESHKRMPLDKIDQSSL